MIAVGDQTRHRCHILLPWYASGDSRFPEGDIAVEFLLGLLTAWFGKKAIAFLDWIAHAVWVWWRATPSMRCHAVMVAHNRWMQDTIKMIDRGDISDPRSISWRTTSIIGVTAGFRDGMIDYSDSARAPAPIIDDK
jgi:hypothetical protein